MASLPPLVFPAAIAGLLTAAGSACAATGAANTGSNTPPPNIVFILADDLGWGELGCYGQQKIKTPNIDRLAAQGVRFTQAYSAAPVCAPARASLMTGLHLGHSPIRGNREITKDDPTQTEGQTPIPAGYTLLPQIFKDAGYATGAAGKWGLGPVGSVGDPLKRGFDHFFGYNCQRAAHSYYPPHLWNDSEKIILNEKPIPGRGKVPEGKPVNMAKWTGKNHSAPPIVEAALRFIDKQAAARKPFFLYLPFIEPHVSLMPEKKFLDMYPENWDQTPYRGENGYTPQTRPRAAYAAMISALDDHVGQVMARLEKHGLADNTIVIFTSDNGTTHTGRDGRWNIGGVDAKFFNSTAGLRGWKGAVYEGGIRIPCIMRWPGKIKPGATADFPTYFPDYIPTLCAAAGIRDKTSGDGINFLPEILGEKAKAERNPMVWVFAEYGGQVAVRLGDFKIMRRDLTQKEMAAWEVYDIVKDPREETNLAGSRVDLIRQAVAILKKEATPNTLFPVPIPYAE